MGPTHQNRSPLTQTSRLQRGTLAKMNDVMRMETINIKPQWGWKTRRIAYEIIYSPHEYVGPARRHIEIAFDPPLDASVTKDFDVLMSTRKEAGALGLGSEFQTHKGLLVLTLPKKSSEWDSKKKDDAHNLLSDILRHFAGLEARERIAVTRTDDGIRIELKREAVPEGPGSAKGKELTQLDDARIRLGQARIVVIKLRELALHAQNMKGFVLDHLRALRGRKPEYHLLSRQVRALVDAAGALSASHHALVDKSQLVKIRGAATEIRQQVLSDIDRHFEAMARKKAKDLSPELLDVIDTLKAQGRIISTTATTVVNELDRQDMELRKKLERLHEARRPPNP